MNIQRLFRKKDYLLARLGQMPRGTLVYRKNGIILWQYRRKEDGKRIQQRVKPEELAETEARFQEKRRLMQSLKNVEVLLQKCGAEERRKARKPGKEKNRHILWRKKRSIADNIDTIRCMANMCLPNQRS